MEALYKTSVTAVGGREGQAKSKDGRLEVSLAPPTETGGPTGGRATNPEQLFAAGYAACFESAVRFVARTRKVNVTKSSVTAEVSLFKREPSGFKLAVTLELSLPEVDKAVATELATEAHEKICPYSHATRGNVDVHVRVV